MDPTDNSARSPGQALWLWWVLATAIGWGAVAWALGAALGNGGLLVMAVVSGAFAGLAQWLVLRPYIPNLRRWLLANTGGNATGITLWVTAAGLIWGVRPFESLLAPSGQMLEVASYMVPGGLLLGAAIGFGQTVVLRAALGGRGRWILTNAAAWAVGSIIGVMVTYAMAGSAWNPALALAIAGPVAAAITGAALMRLLKGRAEEIPYEVT